MCGSEKAPRTWSSRSMIWIRSYGRRVRKYAGQFIRRRIRLVYEGTDVRVLTDEKWLSFIIEQLLSNAVQIYG